MRYWLGPIPWVTFLDGEGVEQGYYAAPSPSLGWIDLRSFAQCATPNAPGEGFGFFATSDDVDLKSEYTLLGENVRAGVTTKQRQLVADALRTPEILIGDTVADMIYDALTRLADPIGDDRCLPLVPTVGRKFELWIAGEKSLSKPFDANGPETAPLQDLLRRQYKAIRQDSLDGKTDTPDRYQKVLGSMVEKYGLDYRWFQDATVPDEQPKKPETTITESFNTSDGDTLGPDLTWTEVAGDWDIVSNRAEMMSNFGSTSRCARAESDLSSSDHYGQCSVVYTSSGYFTGPAARFSSSAQTFYSGQAHGHSFAATHEVVKVVAATRTSLGSASDPITTPVTIKCECNGSTIRELSAGVQKVSLTDSTISSGTRCGIVAYDPSGSTNPQLDSFEAADLGGGGGPSLGQGSLSLLGVGR